MSHIATFLVFALSFFFRLSAMPLIDADSLAQQNLTWQKTNQFRPAILLNGEWEVQYGTDGDWQRTKIPGKCSPKKEVIFRRSFFVDSSLTQRHFRLVSYGINNYCEIFINNKFIGSHAGSYTSFYIDIPPNFIFVNKKNQIEIKVDPRLNCKNTLPLKYLFDGLHYDGGIIRDIFLLALPLRSLAPNIDYSINSDFSECTLTISLDINDWQQRLIFSPLEGEKAKSFAYLIEVFDPLSGRRIKKQFGKFLSDEDFSFSHITEKIKIKNPRLWRPEMPNRYRISVKLFNGRNVVDEFSTAIGFRQLDFFDGNIFLNGKQYFLRGINWQENYGKTGIVFRRDQAVRRLLTIKELNANAVRVPLFPPHPQIAALCDSLGLFLLEEIPLKAVPNRLFSSDIFTNLIRDYLTETIERDKGHASLFAIGVSSGNISGDEKSRLFIEKIYPIISQTESPFFYFTSMPPEMKHSYLPGMFSGISLIHRQPETMKYLLQKWLSQRFKAPTFVTDFGAPRLKFSATEHDSVLYEKYRTAQIAQAYQVIRAFPEIDGCFLTSLCDFKGNYSSTLPGDLSDSYLRPYGVIDANGERRFAFKTVIDLYTTGNADYHPGITIFEGQVNFFTITGLALVLIFLFVTHNRRYFRDNLKRSFVHPHGFYTDIRDGRKIPISHTLLIALFSSASISLILSSFGYFFKANAVVDHILTLLFFTPEAKESIVRQIWHPHTSFLLYTVFILLYFAFLALCFRLAALLLRRRTQISRMIALSFWVGNVYIFLLPVGMIIYRLLKYNHLQFYIFLLLALFDLWYLFRMVRGLRVVFMMPIYKILGILLVFAGLFLGISLYFLQIHSGFWDYLCYYLKIYRSYFHFLA